MLRLILFFILIFNLSSFCQQADTILVQKSPLVITHKVYVLDTNNKESISGISLILGTGMTLPETKEDNLVLRPGPNMLVGISYEKTIRCFRMKLGLGAGQYSFKSKRNLFSTTKFETKTLVNEVVERYYKLIGTDTFWVDIKEEKQITSQAESLEVKEANEVIKYAYLEIPVSFGVVRKIKKFEIEPGVDIHSRIVFQKGNSGCIRFIGWSSFECWILSQRKSPSWFKIYLFKGCKKRF